MVKNKRGKMDSRERGCPLNTVQSNGLPVETTVLCFGNKKIIIADEHFVIMTTLASCTVQERRIYIFSFYSFIIPYIFISFHMDALSDCQVYLYPKVSITLFFKIFFYF